VPPDIPVVTFNHIPFASGMPSLSGIDDEDSPAPSVIRVKGRVQLRHVVSNLSDVVAVIGQHPYPVALGGHFHARERLEWAVDGRTPIRFEQTGAVVGPGGGGSFRMTSGVTVYTIRNGKISEGTFVRLDPVVP
jgi:hypothetical protein